VSTPWLVVNADDLGVSRGATLGIVEAHRRGIVTSASLAATTPFYGHAIEAIRSCPDLGVGLHFTLTSGTPASERSRVPLLVNALGMFRWRFMSLLSATSVISDAAALLDQVEIELESQIQRMIGDGIRPDHINGERHVHLIPAIYDRVIAAARRHGIRYVRAGAELGYTFFGPNDLIALVTNGGVLKSSLLSALTSRNRARTPVETTSPDYVASYLYTGRMDFLLPKLLRSSPQPGITEVMVHPGIPEENGPLSLGNANLEGYLMSPDRQAEMNACIEARAVTTEWHLTNYRQLAARGAS
jgi:predicted glycoside hydrolase/deacetylase ChbG (UPF0249 family)